MNLTPTLTLLAAQPSLVEQVRRVPGSTWITLLTSLIAVVVIVRLWRGLKRINDYAPYLAAMFGGAVLFLLMVYNRSEPRFLTPLVERLTAFFPTKSKQEQDLERLRQSREK